MPVWTIWQRHQFNKNVNEVVSNRYCQLAGTPLDGKYPVHPNDHVNISQLSNDTLASAMHTAAAVNVRERLIPVVAALRDTVAIKAGEWEDIVKIDRTHIPEATPLTLGQELSGYAAMLSDNLERIERNLPDLYKLALGGTAVKTGINSMPGFAKGTTAKIDRLTDLAFVRAPNKNDLTLREAALQLGHVDEATFDRVYAVNVKAPFFLTAAIAPAMVEAGDGVIINLGSWIARLGIPIGALYSSTKGAMFRPVPCSPLSEPSYFPVTIWQTSSMNAW